MKKSFQKTALLLIALFLFCLSGCEPEVPEFRLEGNNGTTCANITMARGAFAWRDGFFYMVGSTGVCEYDMETGKTTTISVPVGYVSSDLIVTADHIGYNDNGLVAVTKDGKTTQRIFRSENCGELYIDGTTAYYRGGANRALYTRELGGEGGAERLILENVNSYHVSDGFIYAVCQEGETYKAVYSPKDEIAFQEIPLSFEPKLILSDGEDLYITEYVSREKSMRVIRVSGGTETPLPIYTYSYQILDGSVIYLDDLTPGTGYKRVMSYDLETGETQVLRENVSEFGVLNGRYIIFEQWEGTEQSFSVLDRQTGEMLENFYTDWTNR